MAEAIYVGIDVSKKHLDYIWLPDGAAHRCENTEEGIESLHNCPTTEPLPAQ